ncbi:MAG: glycosyltransferase family 39 protein [Phycisphaerales bacterium]|nr:MAG: glycosyltransferase family 39 protein [Phycisphaerales bacterium]
MTDPGQQPPTATDDAQDAPTANSRRINWIWLVVIFAVALCFRLIYVLQIRSSPFYGSEAMDQMYHDQWAQAFANGEAYVEGAYFRAPLYPWFLGTIYWLYGTAPIVPRMVQAILGSLSCVLLYMIGRDAFSRRVGVLAGLSAATYWILLYFDAELLIVVLVVFLDLLLIWLLLRTGDRPKPGLWFINGLVLGVSAIARPNILLFAPAVLIWLIAMHRRSLRRLLGYGLCFTSGCFLPVLPITVRNYVAEKDFVLISSQSGVNFYIGNNPESDGMSAYTPGLPLGWWEGYYAQIEEASKALGGKPKPSEVSRYYWNRGWSFYREHPRQALSLLGRKLAYFWSRWEHPNNLDFHFITHMYTPMVRYLPHGFWIVAPLGFLGLLLSMGKAKRLFPLWGFVIVYTITVVTFFVNARYRVPVAAVLILLGSYAVFWTVDAIRLSRWPRICGAVLVLLLISPVVARLPEGVRKKDMSIGYRSAGHKLMELGRLQEAEAMYAEAIRQRPDDATNIWEMGSCLARQNRDSEAEEYFLKTVQIHPQFTEARRSLAIARFNQGKWEEAIPELEWLMQARPHDGELHVQLGSALVLAGRTDEGLTHLLRALELDRAQRTNVLQAALELTRERRQGDAIRVLRAALSLTPDDVPMNLVLSKLLSTAADPDIRDPAAALRLAEHACELSGYNDADAVFALASAQFALQQTEKGLETAGRAHKLAAEQGNKALANRIRIVINHYQDAKEAP